MSNEDFGPCVFQRQNPRRDYPCHSSIRARKTLNQPINKREGKAFAFIAKHPDVYQQFLEYTRQMIATGRKHYRRRMILNAIRFHRDLKFRDRGYRINDHHRPTFARLAEEELDCHGFFEKRKVEGDWLVDQDHPDNDHEYDLS
jgi:hypothetical protein